MSQHIFISYKSEQRSYAFLLRDALHKWGLDPWLDVDRLQPGSYWANDIDNALRNCEALLGIMTPQALASRYVTNEWDLAIMEGKLFIPLMFETTKPHYKYIDIQYVDFSQDDKTKAFELLEKRLAAKSLSRRDQPDPYQDYLQQLYDRIDRYLKQKLITSLMNDRHPDPIRLKSEAFYDTSDLLDRQEQIDPLFALGGIQNETQNLHPKLFHDFMEAFTYYDGRVLALGEPGAGKTITLLQHARDLVVIRKQNLDAALPILGIIPTWDADNESSISDWLAASFGAPLDTQRLIEQGETILLLDGLDELGNRNRCQRFLRKLPTNNQIVITCRAQEFSDIDEKAPLNGTILLKPLEDSQLQHYLRKQPELLKLLEIDTQLKRWMRTPLLLSFFAFAYQEMGIEDRERLLKLSTVDELRHTLFTKYIQQRYSHEERKTTIRKQQMPFALDRILTTLGELAIDTLVAFGKYDYYTYEARLVPLPMTSHWENRFHPWSWDEDKWEPKNVYFNPDDLDLLKFSAQINLLVLLDYQFHFPHILLRNHLAYQRAFSLLQNPDEANEAEIVQAIIALRVLNDPRAIPCIQPYIDDKRTFSFGYHEAASVSWEAKRAIELLKSNEEKNTKDKP